MKTNINIEKAIKNLGNIKTVDELATANIAVIRAISENHEQVVELTNQLVRQIKEELTPAQFIRRS